MTRKEFHTYVDRVIDDVGERRIPQLRFEIIDLKPQTPSGRQSLKADLIACADMMIAAGVPGAEALKANFLPS